MEVKKQIEHFEEEERKKALEFAKNLKNILQLFDPEKIPVKNTSTYICC